MPPSEQDKRLQALQTALAQVEKQFGSGALMRLGERPQMQVQVIPSGSLSLDIALGVGGIPRGRIIELFGAESSGKTTLALHMIAESQKQGGMAAIIDAEHVRSGAIDLLVIDSVAALTPKAEIEGEMGDQFVGAQARMMSQAMRKLAGSLSRSNAAAVFINQIREKIGVMFGSPETTPGGRALKFYSSVRIKTRRASQIKEGATIIGNEHVAQVVKNKVAPPFREGHFDIIFGRGISRSGELLELGGELGLVSKSGSWFSYEGQRIGNGRERAREYLDQNPDMAGKLEGAIRAAHEVPGKTRCADPDAVLADGDE
ncbi:MAG: DNA recombination/repair protein RecA [Armatimonadetes bacterium]|nr:DNA recombination/repair protein RecA [Armatimonadota bacterium]